MKRILDFKPASGAVARALAVAATLVCSVPTGCSSSGQPGDEAAAGSISMRLSLPDGTEITTIEYSITGNEIAPITGAVPVGNSTTISFQVGGIPSGQGYTITLTATTSDGESCTGSSTFDVVAGQVSGVFVAVICGQTSDTGNVQVDVEVNRCASVTGVSALPLEVVVGGSVALSAMASLPSASFEWSATSGELAEPGSASTTYTCSASGEHTITVAVRGGGSLCTTPDTEAVTVTCTGTGTGSGGSSGGGASAGSGGTSAGAAGAGGSSAGTGGTAGETTEIGAPFVDTGYFLRAANPTTALQSFHFASPDGEHQSYFAGNQNLGASGINIERRPYFVFDVGPGGGSVVSARLRLWAWKPATANNNSGAYTSSDPSETFQLWSVESYTAQQIIDAPFNVNAANDLDDLIWADLGDGTPLGSRVYTEADELTDLVPSPNTDPNADCSQADAACGKWVEIELTPAAIALINASSGQWVVGASLTTIGPNSASSEWVNNGVLVDLSPGKSVYPDFLTPAPELILERQVP